MKNLFQSKNTFAVLILLIAINISSCKKDKAPTPSPTPSPPAPVVVIDSADAFIGDYVEVTSFADITDSISIYKVDTTYHITSVTPGVSTAVAYCDFTPTITGKPYQITVPGAVVAYLGYLTHQDTLYLNGVVGSECPKYYKIH